MSQRQVLIRGRLSGPPEVRIMLEWVTNHGRHQHLMIFCKHQLQMRFCHLRLVSLAISRALLYRIFDINTFLISLTHADSAGGGAGHRAAAPTSAASRLASMSFCARLIVALLSGGRKPLKRKLNAHARPSGATR